MKTEPHHFFLTVANYPLSGNIDKYLATLNTIRLNESEMCWWFRADAIFIAGEIKSLMGRMKGDYSFADRDVVAFEKQRSILLKALEHVISGQGLENSGDITRCIVMANEFEPHLRFCLSSQSGGEAKVEKTTFGYRTLTGETQESRMIEEVFNFACYSFISFLASNDRGKIKKCPFCKRYFWAANSKRKYCYNDRCRRYHGADKKRKQRERDPVKYA